MSTSKLKIVSSSELERSDAHPEVSSESNFLTVRQRQSDFQQPVTLESAETVDYAPLQDVRSIQILASTAVELDDDQRGKVDAETEPKQGASNKSIHNANAEPKLEAVRTIFRNSADASKFPSIMFGSKHIVSDSKSSRNFPKDKEVGRRDYSDDDVSDRAVRFSIRDSQIQVFGYDSSENNIQQVQSSTAAIKTSETTTPELDASEIPSQIKSDQITTPAKREEKTGAASPTPTLLTPTPPSKRESLERYSQIQNVVSVGSVQAAIKTSNISPPDLVPSVLSPEPLSNSETQKGKSQIYLLEDDKCKNSFTSTAIRKSNATTSDLVAPGVSSQTTYGQIAMPPKFQEAKGSPSTTISLKSTSTNPLSHIENELLRTLPGETFCDVCHKGEISNIEKLKQGPKAPSKHGKETASPDASKKIELVTPTTSKENSTLTVPERLVVSREDSTPIVPNVNDDIPSVQEKCTTSTVSDMAAVTSESKTPSVSCEDIPTTSPVTEQDNVAPSRDLIKNEKLSNSTLLSESKIPASTISSKSKLPDSIVPSRCEVITQTVPSESKRSSSNLVSKKQVITPIVPNKIKPATQILPVKNKVVLPTISSQTKSPILTVRSMEKEDARDIRPAYKEDFFGNYLSRLRRGECSAKELLKACRQTPDLVLENLRSRRNECQLENKLGDGFFCEFSRTHGERFGDPKYHYLMVDASTSTTNIPKTLAPAQAPLIIATVSPVQSVSESLSGNVSSAKFENQTELLNEPESYEDYLRGDAHSDHGRSSMFEAEAYVPKSTSVYPSKSEDHTIVGPRNGKNFAEQSTKYKLQGLQAIQEDEYAHQVLSRMSDQRKFSEPRSESSSSSSSKVKTDLSKQSDQRRDHSIESRDRVTSLPKFNHRKISEPKSESSYSGWSKIRSSISKQPHGRRGHIVESRDIASMPMSGSRKISESGSESSYSSSSEAIRNLSEHSDLPRDHSVGPRERVASLPISDSSKSAKGSNRSITGSVGAGTSTFDKLRLNNSQAVHKPMTKSYSPDKGAGHETRYKHEVLVDNEPILYEILDTCPKSYDDLPSSETINWADGLLLVYSIIDRRSITFLKKVGSIISDDIPVYIVANKNDMVHLREVSAEEGAILARSFECGFSEVAAAEMVAPVAVVFQELCRGVMASRRKSKHSLLERMLGTRTSNLRLYARGKSDSALPKD